LLDLMMPGLDGYGLLSEMTKDVRLAQIPTVLLSASPGARALTPNVRAFLLKPVHLDKLLAAVTKYVEPA
jgi:CheY-like chemotaxis protein